MQTTIENCLRLESSGGIRLMAAVVLTRPKASE